MESAEREEELGASVTGTWKGGGGAWTSVMFYIVVVQAVILYGSKVWVTSPRIERNMGGLHHRVVRRLTGRMPHQNLDRTWAHPSLEEEMLETGMQEVENYVACHHNTITKFIATGPIMDLCLAAAWHPGSRVSKRWWEQEGLGICLAQDVHFFYTCSHLNALKIVH